MSAYKFGSWGATNSFKRCEMEEDVSLTCLLKPQINSEKNYQIMYSRLVMYKMKKFKSLLLRKVWRNIKRLINILYVRVVHITHVEEIYFHEDKKQNEAGSHVGLQVNYQI
jgi:hypothetical protein